MALEYFYTFTVQLFDVFEPNFLWQLLRQDAQSDESLCYIAAALGHEHMHMAAREQHVTAHRENSCRLNVRALRSMQKRLTTTQQSPVQMTAAAAAFSSLLMAILQGFRGQYTDMLVHLRCGTAIAKQGIENNYSSSSSKDGGGKDGGDGAANPKLNETLRLLRKYCTSTIFFDSIGIEADKTAAIMMANETGLVTNLPSNWKQDEYTLAKEVEVLIEELLQFMRGFRAAHHDSSSGSTITVHTDSLKHPYHNPSLGPKLSKLAAKQMTLEFALEGELCEKEKQKIQEKTAKVNSILLEFALIQCLLARIYLWCCCYNQSRFEDELPTFRRILALERGSLTYLRDIIKEPLCAMPFSLGLGAIACLVSVVRLCPIREIRYEAIQMLDLCPSKDGLWSVELAKRLCVSIVAFEEKLVTAAAAAEGNIYSTTLQVIPSHCRVTYHSFGAASELDVTNVRLFRSLEDLETLVYDDILLS